MELTDEQKHVTKYIDDEKVEYCLDCAAAYGCSEYICYVHVYDRNTNNCVGSYMKSWSAEDFSLRKYRRFISKFLKYPSYRVQFQHNINCKDGSKIVMQLNGIPELIDKDLVPIIRWLNNNGFITNYCCIGTSNKEADGHAIYAYVSFVEQLPPEIIANLISTKKLDYSYAWHTVRTLKKQYNKDFTDLLAKAFNIPQL
jgi:hypothetical protein